MVERISKSFWDRDRIAASGWERRAAEVRPERDRGADRRTEAARRINALARRAQDLAYGAADPDDVEYYILLDVFSGGNSRARNSFAQRFWGGGVRYAGAGFSRRAPMGAILSMPCSKARAAERAGMKVGDEITSVDAAAYHPIRSFRDKVGDKVRIKLRRSPEAAPQELEVEVIDLAPLQAFRDATAASARVLEREGRRIGYVHVWASVGEAIDRRAQGGARQCQGKRMGSRAQARGCNDARARRGHHRHAR